MTPSELSANLRSLGSNEAADLVELLANRVDELTGTLERVSQGNSDAVAAAVAEERQRGQDEIAALNRRMDAAQGQ